MNFNKLIKELIFEDERLNVLMQKFAHEDKVKVNKETGKRKVKKAPLTPDQLMVIVGNDPTSVINGIEQNEVYDHERLSKIDPNEVEKTGEYTNWMVAQFKKLPQTVETPYTEREAFAAEYNEKKKLFFEDLYKVKEDLIKFNRFKKAKDKIQQKDINQHTFASLHDEVKDLSLEMATTTKEERKSSSDHPGAQKMFENDTWLVYKIEDQGELGKEAACFYGGNSKRSSEGETNWCTASPGLSYFNTYIKQGPLYVLLDKRSEKKGNISGLPATRYQFHFESNQFMDPDDRQIDFVGFFNSNPDLKEAFKGIIKSHFQNNNKNISGGRVEVKYPNDGISKLIGLFGFEEFFEGLPKDIKEFDFTYEPYSSRNNDVQPPSLEIPESIGQFAELNYLSLSSCVKTLPESIGNLKNLEILILPNNPDLKRLPNSLMDNIRAGQLDLLVLTNTSLEKSQVDELLKINMDLNDGDEDGNDFILIMVDD